MEKVNLVEKFGKFTELWNPKIVGELNGQYVKLAKLKGEFATAVQVILSRTPTMTFKRFSSRENGSLRTRTVSLIEVRAKP